VLFYPAVAADIDIFVISKLTLSLFSSSSPSFYLFPLYLFSGYSVRRNALCARHVGNAAEPLCAVWNSAGKHDY
jgi:hypothetical protein